MGYRSKYEKVISRKIKNGCEIHHIDLNRKNNLISNLVEIDRRLHIDFHTSYKPLVDIINTIKINGYTVLDYENDPWLKSFSLPYVPAKNWANKLLKCTSKINKAILKRNQVLCVNYDKIIYTEDEMFILNLNIKNK